MALAMGKRMRELQATCAEMGIKKTYKFVWALIQVTVSLVSLVRANTWIIPH